MPFQNVATPLIFNSLRAYFKGLNSWRGWEVKPPLWNDLMSQVKSSLAAPWAYLRSGQRSQAEVIMGGSGVMDFMQNGLFIQSDHSTTRMIERAVKGCSLLHTCMPIGPRFNTFIRQLQQSGIYHISVVISV